MTTSIYLDTCCLSRPFDDQSQVRIRLEAEATLLLLSGLEERNLECVGSEVLDLEVDQIPDPGQRHKVMQLKSSTSRQVQLDEAIEDRAQELEVAGFKAFDALHIACAEAGGVDVLLTTDDRMVKRAHGMQVELKVRVDNPLDWLQENW